MLYDAMHSTIQCWSYASFIFLPVLVRHPNLRINISVAVTLDPARKRTG